MPKPKPNYAGAAMLGYARMKAAERRADNEQSWRRIQAIQEAKEEARMVELARGIHTEELLQQVLSSVEDPALRTKIEARIRPHTQIPVPIHE